MVASFANFSRLFHRMPHCLRISSFTVRHIDCTIIRINFHCRRTLPSGSDHSAASLCKQRRRRQQQQRRPVCIASCSKCFGTRLAVVAIAPIGHEIKSIYSDKWTHQHGVDSHTSERRPSRCQRRRGYHYRYVMWFTR